MRASVKKKNKSQILIKNEFSHVLLDNSPAGELIPQPFTSTFPAVKSMLKEDSCETRKTPSQLFLKFPF